MIENFKDNFICGRKFQLVSDFIIDTDRCSDYNKLENKSIIWCKTDYISKLFNRIKDSLGSYVLITYNSDYSITESKFNSRPKCVKKWFAQNVDCLHEDLISLPIGLENDCGPSKGVYTDYDKLNSNISYNKVRNVESVYCNFNIGNFHTRVKTLDILKLNSVAGIDQRLDYGNYCNNMSKYMFVASPRGNGIDCHRTWEALYLGCIPIVEKHFMYNCYCDLPIIQIDNWEDVDKQWLFDKNEEFRDKNFNYELLNINYWFDKILKERENL